MVILYNTKYKQQIKKDYKIQYQHLGKRKQRTQFSKCMMIALKIFYLVWTSLVLSMLIIRILNLSLRNDDVNLTSFPSQCGSWAYSNGCTRIVKNGTQCVRQGTIPNSYPYQFQLSYVDQDDGTTMNTTDIVQICSSQIGFSKQVYPTDDIDESQSRIFMHLFIETPFFGFINDFYIEFVQQFYVSNSYVQVQSQSRLSGNDLMQNYNYVETFFKCLKTMTDEQPIVKSCS
ncbi:UNKNOWN [Stylonychia lemnae]|uniref:Transmembrane protein n=1 Tax=Stylonychia lemnae TaxID=5949 RepID=A0A078A0C1_STYLE|nr:UNKNOWN [Stylonychia lemnae]|eukprot:CDW75646.1 UNKNOWN [Stylonychia lemnae]